HTAAIRRMIAGKELPGNIYVAGYASTPLDAISQCNVVLNLSSCQETFGRTMLEAMAARRAVMAYRIGALSDIVLDGVNGYLVDFGDVEAMAERLSELSRDVLRLQSLGEAGRDLAATYS